jgi:hypothetical protein
MCSTPAPVAAATTAPPEEPPGVILGFQGFRVTPVKGLSVIAADAAFVWLEVRVLPAPPRSLTQMRLSAASSEH